MKITVRGVLLCRHCSHKDPDFMDVWLRNDLMVAVVVSCRNCGYAHYSNCPMVDDEIIVSTKMHWIRHSQNPVFTVNGVITGYRHNFSDLWGRADSEKIN